MNSRPTTTTDKKQMINIPCSFSLSLVKALLDRSYAVHVNSRYQLTQRAIKHNGDLVRSLIFYTLNSFSSSIYSFLEIGHTACVMPSTNDTQPISSGLKVYPVRLSPNMDVLVQIRSLMTTAKLRSVFIMSCVGSVKACRLRMANSKETIDLQTPHEIVSLVGTFDGEGEHVHGAFSDSTGRVVAGHVMGDFPMVVFTTAEMVLGECTDVVFSRDMDPQTGYPELVIRKEANDE